MNLTAFTERHVRIYSQNSPTEPDGRNLIKLNQQQHILINHLSLFDKLGVIQDRQIGCTTLLSAYIAHWLIYNEDVKRELLVVANNSYVLDKVWDILMEVNEHPMAEGKTVIRCGNNKVICLSSISARVSSRTYGIIVDNASALNSDNIFDIMSYEKLVKKLIVVGCYQRNVFSNDFMYNIEYDKIFKLQLKTVDSTMPDFITEKRIVKDVNFNVRIPLDLLHRLQNKLDDENITLAEYLETIV